MNSPFRTEIEATLKKNRPNLHSKSLTSYISTLYNLPKKVNPQLIPHLNSLKVDYFSKNVESILNYLQIVKPSPRKTILSALYVLTGIEAYNGLMRNDIQTTAIQNEKQIMTEKQQESWVSWDQVIKLHQQYEVALTKMLSSKASLNQTQMHEFCKFILLSCFVYIEPRRAMDYSEMKIRNINPETDNFIDIQRKVFVFNKYKTAKTYGSQAVPIPSPLIHWIILWSNFNKSDYLLIKKSGSKLNPNSITSMFYQIFKSNVSVNILRHSYLSSLYQNIPQLVQMKQTAKNMGHSVDMALQYIKRAPVTSS